MGLLGVTFTFHMPELHMGVPVATLGFVKGFTEALRYLPIAFSFALLTITKFNKPKCWLNFII
jgi:hypothetical protein